MRDYKPFGYEVLSCRFGGVIARVDDAIKTLEAYLNGEIAEISEICQEILVNEELNASTVIELITASSEA